MITRDQLVDSFWKARSCLDAAMTMMNVASASGFISASQGGPALPMAQALARMAWEILDRMEKDGEL